jgi:beta-propeller repeat-containing protein/flagellar hook capping protein FlgD
VTVPTSLRALPHLALLLALTSWATPAGAARLLWSGFLGGSGADNANAVTSGAQGDIYVAGSTASANFPVTTGAYRSPTSGGKDVWVARLDPTGTTVVWCARLGGTANDEAQSLAVDAGGNVYVCGYTYSTEFPVTASAYQRTLRGFSDGFVAKLSADGQQLLWSTFLGGTGDEGCGALAVDGSGNVYVGGSTSSTDFPTTAGTIKRTRTSTLSNVTDGFLTKIAPSGATLVYSTYIGTDTGDDEVDAICVDLLGRVAMAGSTSSGNFPTTAGAWRRTASGLMDCFAARINDTATGWVFSTYLGGANDDYSYAVAQDPAGDVYVAGRTSSADFPTLLAAQPGFGGGTDGFVTKVTPAGGLAFSSFAGGSAYDDIRGVAVTTTGAVCLTGTTGSTNLPLSTDALTRTSCGGWDAFVETLAASGSLRYASYLGSPGSDLGYAVNLRGDGSTVVAGWTDGAQFPATTGSFDPTQNSAGVGDAFIAAFDLGLVVAQLAVPGRPDVSLSLDATRNPFAHATSIRFAVSSPQWTQLDIHDLQGRLVRTLWDGPAAPGTHAATWNALDAEGRSVPPGVYLVGLRTVTSQRVLRLVRID